MRERKEKKVMWILNVLFGMRRFKNFLKQLQSTLALDIGTNVEMTFSGLSFWELLFYQLTMRSSESF